MSSRNASRQTIGLAQIGLGVATIALARRIATAPWLGLSREVMAQIVRVLGTRQVLQGAATVALDDPRLLTVASGVDALHALSMVPVAVAPGPYRGAATISATLAGAFAAVEHHNA